MNFEILALHTCMQEIARKFGLKKGHSYWDCFWVAFTKLMYVSLTEKCQSHIWQSYVGSSIIWFTISYHCKYKMPSIDIPVLARTSLL